jgi:hypothetical protein
MLSHCSITEFSEGLRHLQEADVVIIDKLSNEAVDMINTDTLVLSFIHNAGEVIYPQQVDLSRKFICMSETAVQFQSKYIPREKLLLCHQGVDMTRFVPRVSSPPSEKTRVLVFTRLARQKRATLTAVLDELLKEDRYNITVLGDGDFFWELSNTYGNRVTVINHIPCNSIQNFLPGFDLIISSARGVMEACASGIPAICAGFGYAGVVSEEKIPGLMVRNLTGYGEQEDLSAIHQEIQKALGMHRSYWRSLSKKHFDMDNFFLKIANEVHSTLYQPEL